VVREAQLYHTVPKEGIVVVPLREIEHHVGLLVSLCQKGRHILDRIAVHGFQIRRGEGHRQETRSDVSQVQIVLPVADTVTTPTDRSADDIHGRLP
jgi:hypothetical protein